MQWLLLQHSWHVPLQQTWPLPQDVPLSTVVHVPTDPSRLHASHALSQAMSQQTPSTQCPEVHSPLRSHVVPFPCLGRHWEPSQKEPATQPLSLLQVVAQVVPLAQ